MSTLGTQQKWSATINFCARNPPQQGRVRLRQRRLRTRDRLGTLRGMKSIGPKFFMAALLGLTIAASASAGCRAPLHGINLVPLPSGWYNGAVELKFPTAAHIAYYKNVGMNAIRLPVVWDTLQPSLFGELDRRYLTHIVEFLDLAHAQAMPVLIDLHNYARYRGKLVGTGEVPVAALEDVWRRIALALSSHPAVFAYGLMNEPHDTAGLWPAAAQAGVNGVRHIDVRRPIFVGGDSWSNAQRWPAVNPQPFVNDPAKRIVYEAHIYFDDDFSGRYKTGPGNNDLAKRAAQRLQPFLDWIAANGQQGAIGETGVPMDDPRWLDAMAKFLAMTQAACMDWFIWAGGGWRPTYELSHEPLEGRDRPQVELLRRHLATPPTQCNCRD